MSFFGGGPGGGGGFNPGRFPGNFTPGAPPNYGRDDLDPQLQPIDPRAQQGGSGGMVMDPRDLHPSRGNQEPQGGSGSYRIPPGSVPPGARFDPFGPVGPEYDPRRPDLSRTSGGEPDPDHMRPPH